MGVFGLKPFPVDLTKILFTKYPSRNSQATTTVFIFQMFFPTKQKGNTSDSIKIIVCKAPYRVCPLQLQW